MAASNRKNIKRIPLWFFIFLVLGFIYVITDPFLDPFIYPVKYKDNIFLHAKRTGVDPYLIMAMIRVETKFNPYVESRAGAQGLMQLMPDTVQFAFEKGKYFSVPEVTDPDTNIYLGSWYFSVLKKQFVEPAAIAAYNAGPGNVRKWINESRWDGTRKNIEGIPFGETRRYVDRVYYFYERYREYFSK